ncbi:MAG: DUF4293 domain-containing protein [Bacteroidales bacterium]|jgi:hypothetical protein|nr:DUF4293 domain-containing protein [Bacteroidales bacterium]
MIQRKQTIFLLLALFSFVFLFAFPFASFKLGTEITCYISLLAIQNLDGFDKLNYMFIIMQVLATLFLSLTGVAIFMFKKRPLQVRLCAFAFLTNVFIIGAMFLTASMVVKELNFANDNLVTYLLPMYIPILTAPCVMFAQRAIRKDEAMVRSLNRLR